MDILNEIRDYRNQELIDNKDNSVFYTKVMALEKGENTGKQIYRIIEEYSVGENQSKIRELFYEYDQNVPKLIAILDNNYDIILPVEELVKNDESKKEWEFILKDIQNGIEICKENLEKEALKLGISQKEIEGISEIDLDKKIYFKIKEINKQNKTEKTENKEKTVNIPSEEAKKYGIIGMNTISLNQKVGIHGETLKSGLGIENNPQYADVEEIEWVPAYKTKELGITVPDVPLVPIAKHKNGELETFPESICRPYKGENNEIIEIDGNEDIVTKQKSYCMYEFANGKSLTAKQTTFGRCESSLAYNTTNNDGRVAITTQDKYDGTTQSDTEARQIVDSYQGKEQYNKIRDEANSHLKTEIADRKNADGIEETGHKHLEHNTKITPDTILLFENKEMTVREIAADARFKLSPEGFIEKYYKVIDSLKNLTEDEIYDQIEKEANNDIRNRYESN